MIGPTGNWPHHMELIQVHCTLKNITTGQSVGSFKINWTEDLSVLNCVGNIRCILRKPFHTAIGKRLFDVVPLRVHLSACTARIERTST